MSVDHLGPVTAKDVITRLRNAAEGSRHLDEMIAGLKEVSVAVVRFSQGEHSGPHYSTSIDGALKLVPPGWLWGVQHSGHPVFGDYAWVTESEDANHDEAFLATAKTPALALCIAALEARQAVPK